MTLTWRLQSLRFRLLGPLLALLLAYVLLFGYLTWSFRQEYSSLSQQVAAHSEITREVMEVSRTRARTQEVLLVYRLNGKSVFVQELAALERIRTASLAKIQAFAVGHPSVSALASSLVAGLSQTAFLREKMVEAIRAKNLGRADEAFRQLSNIFEINSARLKDFSLHLDSELRQDELRLQSIVNQAFAGFTIAIVLVAATIWVIAIFYRKNVLLPMQRLHNGLQALAAGDLRSRIEMGNAPLELEEMMKDFNQMAKSLEHSQGQVQLALQLRDEFLSIASHELKTPLTSLRLQAQMTKRGLQNGPPLSEEKVRKLVDQFDLQVNRLNLLVDEMLDVTRIEAGKLEPRLGPVELSDLVRGVCDSFAPQIKNAGCTLEFGEMQKVLGQWDTQRIEQVVINLLTNAMKYGSGRPIGVQVSRKEESALLAVRDQGVGIAKENQDRIFERFERAISSSAVSGLGLGLYIVKKIVTAHHGSVKVQSEEGRGSTFIVELPLRPPPLV